METLYLVQETDQETHVVYTLYRLTSLRESPTKVAEEGGFSVWPDDRELSPLQWAQQTVYDMEGETGDNVTIKQF